MASSDLFTPGNAATDQSQDIPTARILLLYRDPAAAARLQARLVAATTTPPKITIAGFDAVPGPAAAQHDLILFGVEPLADGALPEVRAVAPATPLLVLAAADHEAQAATLARQLAGDYLLEDQLTPLRLAHLIALAVAHRQHVPATGPHTRQAEAERDRLARIVDELPVGVFIATGDPASRSVNFTLINREGQRLLAAPTVTPGVVNETFTVYHPDGTLYAEEDLPLQHTLWTGKPAPEQELVFRYHNGEERTLVVSSSLLSEADGIYEAILVDRDISERLRLEEALRGRGAELEQQQALLATIIAQSPIGLLVLDRDLRIVHSNDEYRRITGHSGVAHDLAPDATNRQEIYTRVLAGESADLQNVVYYNASQKRTHYCDLRYRPVSEPGGGIRGVVCAVVDVTERYGVERQKDEFLSLASHELRTPMTAIKGYTQMLLRRARETRDERLIRPLTIMEDQADRLIRLINDLLDVTRVERAELPLYPERFDLRQLVHDATATLIQTTPEFSFRVDLPEEMLEVHADRQRIEQVMANLLENAVKYSRKDRRVEVSLTCTAQEAVTAVRDYGVGIPPDQQDKVFERFFRGRNAGSHVRNGLGLGLYISRDIVSRHGGRIWLDSTLELGSTFYFALPLVA